MSLTDEQIDACVYKQCPDFDQWHEGPSIDDCRVIARATAAPLLERIAELEQQLEAAQQEPVAQWQKRHPVRTDGKWENTNEPDAKWWRDNSMGWEIRALYTAAAPQREPMTQDQVHALCDEAGYSMDFPQEVANFINGIRWGERFHGITKKEQQ